MAPYRYGFQFCLANKVQTLGAQLFRRGVKKTVFPPFGTFRHFSSFEYRFAKPYVVSGFPGCQSYDVERRHYLASQARR